MDNELKFTLTDAGTAAATGNAIATGLGRGASAAEKMALAFQNNLNPTLKLAEQIKTLGDWGFNTGNIFSVLNGKMLRAAETALANNQAIHPLVKSYLDMHAALTADTSALAATTAEITKQNAIVSQLTARWAAFVQIKKDAAVAAERGFQLINQETTAGTAQTAMLHAQAAAASELFAARRQLAGVIPRGGVIPVGTDPMSSAVPVTAAATAQYNQMASAAMALANQQNQVVTSFQNAKNPATELASKLRFLETSGQGTLTMVSALRGELGQATAAATANGQAIPGIVQKYQMLAEATADVGKKTKESEGLFASMGITMGHVKNMVMGLLIYRVVWKAIELVTGAIYGTIKAGIEFEQAFAQVKRTVGGTGVEMQQMSKDILQLSTVIPVTAVELSKIAAYAGQLGITTPNITKFTETMARMAATTNLSMEDAATTVAKFMQIMGTSQTDVDRLASTVVKLGVNTAATEGEIMKMAFRLGGAANMVGMTEAQVIGLSATLASLGMRADLGGSAISKTLRDMATAIADGGDKLKAFAAVSGLSIEKFSDMFRRDASGALMLFLEKLARYKGEAPEMIALLDELGIKQSRQIDALARTGGAVEEVRKNIIMANEAWKENTALLGSSKTAWDTAHTQLELLKNNFFSLGVAIGEGLLPFIESAARGISNFLGAFMGKSSWVSDFAQNLGYINVNLSLMKQNADEAVRALKEAGFKVSPEMEREGRYSDIMSAAGINPEYILQTTPDKAQAWAQIAKTIKELKNASDLSNTSLGDLSVNLATGAISATKHAEAATKLTDAQKEQAKILEKVNEQYDPWPKHNAEMIKMVGIFQFMNDQVLKLQVTIDKIDWPSAEKMGVVTQDLIDKLPAPRNPAGASKFVWDEQIQEFVPRGVLAPGFLKGQGIEPETMKLHETELQRNIRSWGEGRRSFEGQLTLAKALLGTGKELSFVYENFGKIIEKYPEYFTKAEWSMAMMGRMQETIMGGWMDIGSTIEKSLGDAVANFSFSIKGIFGSIWDSWKKLISDMIGSFIHSFLRPMLNNLANGMGAMFSGAGFGAVMGGGGTASMAAGGASWFANGFPSGASGGGASSGGGSAKGIWGGGRAGSVAGGLGSMAASTIGMSQFQGSLDSYGWGGFAKTWGSGILAGAGIGGMIGGPGGALVGAIIGSMVGQITGIVKAIMGRPPGQSGAMEAGRDFKVNISQQSFEQFATGLGLTEKTYGGIRKDISSSPKFLTEVLFPQAKATGTTEAFLKSLESVTTAWGTFNFRSAFETWMKTGDSTALNKAFIAAFSVSQRLQEVLPDWQQQLMAAGDKSKGANASRVGIHFNPSVTGPTYRPVTTPTQRDAPVTVNITVEGYYDSAGAKKLFENEIGPELVNQLSMNKPLVGRSVTLKAAMRGALA